MEKNWRYFQRNTNLLRITRLWVVRELVGHGLGEKCTKTHKCLTTEEKGSGKVLEEDGIALAIEPMINLGTEKVKFHNDGWTVTTLDNLPLLILNTMCILVENPFYFLPLNIFTKP